MENCTYLNMVRVGFIKIKIQVCRELISKNSHCDNKSGSQIGHIRSNGSSLFYAFCIEIIDQQHNDEYYQSKEFSCLFYPRLFSLHRISNICSVMFCKPIPNSILVKKFVDSIPSINHNSKKISRRKIFFAKCKPAEHCSVQIDWHPDVRIRIIVLQGSKKNK